MKKFVIGICFVLIVAALTLSGISRTASGFVDPQDPTLVPTLIPSLIPTEIPTSIPTVTPSTVPTSTSTAVPTSTSTAVPTSTSTAVPTLAPTSIPVIVNDLAGGTWTKGVEVPMFFVNGTAPSWLQMLTNPVIMPFAGTTCHEFRGAQFGWTGEIRQLVDGQWIKVNATISQVSPESVFTACVYAPKAGIYTLFGYYSEE